MHILTEDTILEKIELDYLPTGLDLRLVKSYLAGLWYAVLTDAEHHSFGLLTRLGT